MWTTTAAISTSRFSSALGDKALLFCAHVPCTDAEVFQSCHNKVLILGLHYFPFMLSTTCSIVTIFHTNNTLYVYLRVGPCHHTGSTCSSVYQLCVCVCVHPLYKCCKREGDDWSANKQTAGRKKTHTQVWRQPGMLGLLSLWANTCPSRATVAMNILLREEKMWERKWEKQRKW